MQKSPKLGQLGERTGDPAQELQLFWLTHTFIYSLAFKQVHKVEKRTMNTLSGMEFVSLACTLKIRRAERRRGG
jgi:hypothetical protein